MKRLRPREAFPDEVIALHDEQGVPWPAWYSGPLYCGDKASERKALEALQRFQNDESRPEDGSRASV